MQIQKGHTFRVLFLVYFSMYAVFPFCRHAEKSLWHNIAVILFQQGELAEKEKSENN
jgi:hypothetical protein